MNRLLPAALATCCIAATATSQSPNSPNLRIPRAHERTALSRATTPDDVLALALAPPPVAPAVFCAPTIRDQGVPVNCLSASSIPALGSLYPLSPDLFVDPIGNVGMGTLVPVAKLEIDTADFLQSIGYSSSAPDGAQYLAFNDTGFDAAAIGINGTAHPFPSMMFVWNYANADMRIGTNNVERVRIKNNGWVGIGTAAPVSILTVRQFAGNPIADGWAVYSSRRWKENFEPLTGALEHVLALRGVRFDWKDTKRKDVGMIAEEVGAVLPEVVDFEENGTDAKSIDYGRLTAVLVEAIKEQQKEIDELKRLVKSQ